MERSTGSAQAVSRQEKENAVVWGFQILRLSGEYHRRGKIAPENGEKHRHGRSQGKKRSGELGADSETSQRAHAGRNKRFRRRTCLFRRREKGGLRGQTNLKKEADFEADCEGAYGYRKEHLGFSKRALRCKRTGQLSSIEHKGKRVRVRGEKKASLQTSTHRKYPGSRKASG